MNERTSERIKCGNDTDAVRPGQGIIFFGAFGVPPFSHEDDPVRAVKAAKDIYSGLMELGYESAIGVCTGNVFAGVVGSALRHEYTVIGDTINMSARLMASASTLGVPILVDQETYELCRLRIEFAALDAIKVKGRSDPVPVHTVVLNTNTRSRRNTLHAIVGREREKAMLRTILSSLPRRDSFAPPAVTAAPAQALLLEGARGIGKSLLASFTAETGRSLGFHVWSSTCDASHKLTPLFVWRGILLHLFGLGGCSGGSGASSSTGGSGNNGTCPANASPSSSAGSDDSSGGSSSTSGNMTPTAYKTLLERLRTEVDSSWRTYLPLLQPLVPLPFTDSEKAAVAEMSLSERTNVTRNLLQYLIQAHSSPAPLVIIIENIQWIDSQSLALIVSLLEVLKSAFILLTSSELPEQQRRERYEPLLSLPNLKTYAMEPLTPEEAMRLVGVLVCLSLSHSLARARVCRGKYSPQRV